MSLQSLLNDLVSEHGLCYHIYNDKFSEHLPFSVKLELSFESRVYESWGVSKNRDLAFFKALMEMVERVSISKVSSIYFKKSFFSRELSLNEISERFCIPTYLLIPDSSNGAGVGSSSMMAKKSAKFELIERHTILSALFLGVSPREIKFEEDCLLPTGHSLNFYYWRSNSLYVVVAIDKLPNSGFLFTHACSSNFEKARQKAFEEIIPNILHFDKYGSSSSKLFNIVKDDILSFNRYWKYSGDKRILDFFENPKSHDFEKIPKLKDIYFSEIPICKIFSPKNIPLKCYRAISPQAQQLFFDEWKMEYINPRLRSSGQCPDYPHFIS